MWDLREGDVGAESAVRRVRSACAKNVRAGAARAEAVERWCVGWKWCVPLALSISLKCAKPLIVSACHAVHPSPTHPQGDPAGPGCYTTLFKEWLNKRLPLVSRFGRVVAVLIIVMMLMRLVRNSG